MGFLFVIFWLWVLVAGFKSVGRRMFGLFSGWSSESESRVFSSPNVYHRPASNQPLLVPNDTADIWTPAERRGFGRKLALSAPVSTNAVVGEMQRELAKLIRNAAQVERNLAKWQGDLHRIEAAQADWHERARLAVDKGRDQLARAALEQKTKLDPRADGLKADIGRLEELLAGYRRDIGALENKLDESVRRQVLAESRLEGAEGSVRTRELVFGERTKAALCNLEDVERAADLAEGEAEALALGEDPGLAGEFAALERQDALDKELAALKKQRRTAA